MSYRPRTDNNRWARDQIVAALRSHGVLTTAELARTIGCREWVLRPVIANMRRHREIDTIRVGVDSTYQLGVDAPAAVDVEAFEPYPMSGNGEPVD